MNVQFVAKFPVSFNTGLLELDNEETCDLIVIDQCPYELSSACP